MSNELQEQIAHFRAQFDAEHDDRCVDDAGSMFVAACAVVAVIFAVCAVIWSMA